MQSTEQHIESLRASEEHLRYLVEGVKEYAIFMLDPAGKVLTWNSGANLIFGYSSVEAIGGSYAQFFRTESGVSVQQQCRYELERAAQQGSFEIAGWRFRKDGSRFWSDGILTALYNEQGEVRGFAKITRDLTQEHWQDRLLHSVLDHTIDSIICIDSEGLIEAFNEAAEGAFGYSKAEILGNNISTLLPDPPREPKSYMQNFLQAKTVKTFGVGREVQAQHKDGTSFPVRLQVSDLPAELDDSRHYTAIIHNLTEHRKLEAQVLVSQKMEAFGQLAGGVAHDFNNLLTVINGYSEMLLRECAEDDPSKAFLMQILRAGERASSLTRQMLAFSRQQILEPKVLNLNAVVKDAERLLGRLIGEDLMIVMNLSSTLDPVKIDPGQMEQVIMNLVVNARDAMPDGGEITMETRNILLDNSYVETHPEVKAGYYVLLAVADSGSGMAADIVQRIFEPFFTTKDMGKGTGLGLSVVQGIVKQSGGSIQVQSEIGVGTTFNVYLPAVRERLSKSAALGELQPALGTETILLVEDENAVREVTAVALHGAGYTVLKASRGNEAMQLMVSHAESIDLLITDVVMPEMSGGKLAEILQVRYPRLKILFLSGYMDDALIRNGIQQDRVAFLHKPFTVSSLTRKVRDVLDHEQES